MMSGISSSFGGNENIIRIQGMAISGLVTNTIALGCTYFSNRISLRFKFLIYLLVGDIILVIFYIMKMKFFNSLKDISAFLPSSQSLPAENSQEIELENVEDKLLNKSEEKDDAESDDVFAVLRTRWIDFMNIFLAFGTCLACFPVLIFQFDISEVASYSYKFILITFIFNIGDYLGRLAIEYFVIPIFVNNILSAFKIFTVYICYLVVTNPNNGLLSFLYFKLGLILVIGFLTGYIPCASFVFARNYYEGKPKHLTRVGQIFQYSIQMGLLLGSFFAYVMF